jgi:hypothetical protein
MHQGVEVQRVDAAPGVNITQHDKQFRPSCYRADALGQQSHKPQQWDVVAAAAAANVIMAVRG